MKKLQSCLTLLVAVTLVGCSTTPKSADVSSTMRRSLDQANLKDVSVSQDRDKGVVTLSGQVATDGEKSQAESIAKSLARDQVVSDQIAVVPSSGANDAKAINSDLDKGIEKNLDAALIQNRFHKRVKIRCQEWRSHANWRGHFSISACAGGKGCVFSYEREASSERAAGSESKGHVVEVRAQCW
jgi:hypothetical protein